MTIEMLTACLRGYPNARATNETIMFYTGVLSDLSFHQVRAALFKLVRTLKYFPTPAEIIEAAEEIGRAAGDNQLPTAGEAWEEAMKLVKTCHMYKPWMYSCPEVAKAVEQFGRESLVRLDQSEVGRARAQFRNIYNEILEQEKAQRHNARVLKQMGPNAAALITGAANSHDMNRLQAPKEKKP